MHFNSHKHLTEHSEIYRLATQQQLLHSWSQGVRLQLVAAFFAAHLWHSYKISYSRTNHSMKRTLIKVEINSKNTKFELIKNYTILFL